MQVVFDCSLKKVACLHFKSVIVQTQHYTNVGLQQQTPITNEHSFSILANVQEQLVSIKAYAYH